MSRKPHYNLNSPDFIPILDDLLRHGSRVRFQVNGRSMAPFLKGGEKVTVMQTADYLPGDLVLLANGEKIVLHRLVKKKRGGSGLSYVTKGDGVAACDQPVRRQEILAKVVAIEQRTESGQRTIDLESRSWKNINPLLALVSRIRGSWTWLASLPFQLRFAEHTSRFCWKILGIRKQEAQKE